MIMTLCSSCGLRFRCCSAAPVRGEPMRETAQNKLTQRAQPGQPIAPARVDRRIAAESIGRIELAANVSGKPGDDAPVRIHRRRIAIVGIAQQPAPILHGANAGHLQMLCAGPRNAQTIRHSRD